MKKFIAAVVIIGIVVVLAGAGLLRYVSPSEPLDLQYKPVPIGDRALAMARSLSLDLTLSGDDVNNIAKEALARNPEPKPGIVVTGARFRIINHRLAADVNLELEGRIPVGLKLLYRLEWKDPNLTAVLEEAKLKDVTLPKAYFDDIVIPLGSLIPKPLQVKTVTLGDDGLTIEFRKPSVKDLQELLPGGMKF